MLALILPPFLVVVAIALLLYLFFRKLPEVERRERERSGESSGALLSVSDRMKRLSLGIVERLARLFKLLSLKIHNKLTTLASSAHSARVQVADRIAQRKQLRAEKANALVKGNFPSQTDAPDNTGFPVSSETSVPPVSESDRQHRLRRWFGKDARHASSPLANTDESRSVNTTPPPSEEEDLPPLVSEPLQPILEERSMREVRKSAADIGRTLGNAVRRLRSTRERTTFPARSAEPVVPQKREQLEDILVERISLNPRDIEAYERLGDYYLEQGNLVDAKECYRQVLKLSPAYRLVKIKIRKLERLLEKDRTP